MPGLRRVLLLAGALLSGACDGPASNAAARQEGAEQPGSVTTTPRSEPALVFLGDSLTAGLGLSESEALPARIQARLDAEHLGYRCINAGRSGDTTAGGLARLDWYFRDSVDVRVLIIGLGSNDAMRGLSLEAMEANLRQMIRRTRAHKPEAKILLWELRTFPNMGKEYSAAYEGVFPRVADSEKVTLIPFPLEDVAARPELNQADGIHPTAEGAEKVAARIWSVLRPQL